MALVVLEFVRFPEFKCSEQLKDVLWFDMKYYIESFL